MIGSFVLVTALLIVGDVVMDMVGAPVPGAVPGLVVLAVILAAREGGSPPTERLFDAVIPFAPMLFVPAGVGVVANLELIASAWAPVVVAITLGTAVTIVVTGLAAQALFRLYEGDRRRAS